MKFTHISDVAALSASRTGLNGLMSSTMALGDRRLVRLLLSGVHHLALVTYYSHMPFSICWNTAMLTSLVYALVVLTMNGKNAWRE